MGMGNVGSSHAAPVRPAVVMQGTVNHRPWAATLAAIGIGGRSGQLTLRGGNKIYRIAFSHGIVVGAMSPIAADSVSRIALAHHMVSPAQVQAITKSIGRAKADDVERFAEASGLAAAQVQLLKRRVLTQRTARTFDVDAGEYTVDDRISIPVLVGVAVDVRAAIYLGVRKYLAAERLGVDLRQLGAQFVLRPDAAPELSRFDLGEAEQPVLDALRDGTSLPELEAVHRELDPRMMQAVLVALAACDAIVQSDLAGRVPTPREPTMTRVPTPRQQTMSCVPMLIGEDPEVTPKRLVTRAPPPKRAPTTPRAMTYRAVTDPFLEAQATSQRPSPLSLAQVKRLIGSRAALLGKGVDHFEFLGIPFNASVAQVRTAYVELARYLRLERLKELGISDEHHDARSVFAQVVIAHTVLTDPVRRAEYLAALHRTP
ncbi:hypothetical protein BH11MYX3_BH11MYX3_27090 [soil metagenome]